MANLVPVGLFAKVSASLALSTLAGLIMLIGGVLWLNKRSMAAKARNEGYGSHKAMAADAALPDDVQLPGFALAIAPVVLVIALNAVFTYLVFPHMDASYLSEDKYGATSLKSVAGIWAIIAALLSSIVLVIAANWKRFEDIKDSINQGTMGSLLPIFNTASEVGYGAVIAALPAFLIVRDLVLELFPDNPLASLAVAVNVLAGITGSASGGMSIALGALGDQFAELGNAQGIGMGLMHRVTALSSGGFDALPHNGAVITLLGICGLTHKQSYADIFICAVAIPVVATVTVIVLGSMV